MTTPHDELSLYRIAVLEQRGIRLDGQTLTLRSGTTLELPTLADADGLADLPSALPSRARGDAREKLLYNVVQDLSDLKPADRQPEAELWAALGDRVGSDPSSKRTLTAVMRAQYLVEPTRRAGSTGSPFLSPFHAYLPGAYDYHGRYKSFRGSLLLFLSWTGSAFDTTVVDELTAFLASDDGLILLDEALLRVARELVVEADRPQPKPTTANLLSRYEAELRARFANGVFDQPGLTRMREDLHAVLRLSHLPRHDKIAAIIQCTSINLALYYYRLAFTLGTGIDACVAAGAGTDPGEAPSFEGRLLFRVGSAGDRPVKVTAPCAQSFQELDGHHLLALPASMATTNVLHAAAVAAGVAERDAVPDPHALAKAMHADPDAAEAVDAVAALLSLHIAGPRGYARASRLALDPGSGCYALRESTLDNFRQRSLKQRGRDVVHTLVGGYAGGLKRSRGKVSFFELDESVLELLVWLVLGRSGAERLNFRSAFLPQLRAYGLQPQDPQEEAELANALERLGLLRRFSDAGEALYVSRN